MAYLHSSEVVETGTIPVDDPILNAPGVPDQVRDRIIALSERVETITAEIDGARSAAASAQEDIRIAQTNLGHAEQASLDPRSTVTEAQLAALSGRVEKAKARAQAASNESQGKIAERNNTRKMLADARHYLNGKKVHVRLDLHGNPTDSADYNSTRLEFRVDLVDVDLPEGSPAEIVAAQRREVARLRRQRKEVDEAPLPAEMVKDQLRAEIEGKAHDAAPRVDIGRIRRSESGLERRDVRVEWPRVPIAGTQNDGVGGLRITDTVAMLYRLLPEAVIADVERAVDAAYEGVELALDPTEQRKRLKHINREILAAERIEAAATWLAAEAGEAIAFRAGIAPKAVLGIA